jgi:hypothetical protein
MRLICMRLFIPTVTPTSWGAQISSRSLRKNIWPTSTAITAKSLRLSILGYVKLNALRSSAPRPFCATTLLLILLQALQLHTLKVLALSTIPSHLFLSWMQILRSFNFTSFRSFFMSFAQLGFHLPCGCWFPLIYFSDHPVTIHSLNVSKPA